MSDQMIISVLFYVFAGTAVFASLLILFKKNIIHSAFLLVLVFLCIAGVFVLMRADFLAIAQIMIYIGGVLILMLFGIMLTNRLTGGTIVGESKNRFLGFVIASTLFYLMIRVIRLADFTNVEWIKQTSVQPKALMNDGSLKVIGEKLMTSHVLPFEVAGVILLVALIGASLIASHSKKEAKP